MFDKLVESAKQKQGRRARRLFLVTGAIYAVALTALGVATVIGFNAALAEEYDVIGCMTPPAPSEPAPNPVRIKTNLKSEPDPGFMVPVKTTPPPKLDELDPMDWKPIQSNSVPGGVPTGIGSG